MSFHTNLSHQSEYDRAFEAKEETKERTAAMRQIHKDLLEIDELYYTNLLKLGLVFEVTLPDGRKMNYDSAVVCASKAVKEYNQAKERLQVARQAK
tara:strand:- start:3206 stop:3493 length:288 start_codon:yes stop_codon:yes gene_type:complete